MYGKQSLVMGHCLHGTYIFHVTWCRSRVGETTYLPCVETFSYIKWEPIEERSISSYIVKERTSDSSCEPVRRWYSDIYGCSHRSSNWDRRWEIVVKRSSNLIQRARIQLTLPISCRVMSSYHHQPRMNLASHTHHREKENVRLCRRSLDWIWLLIPIIQMHCSIESSLCL